VAAPGAPRRHSPADQGLPRPHTISQEAHKSSLADNRLDATRREVMAARGAAAWHSARHASGELAHPLKLLILNYVSQLILKKASRAGWLAG
jgi:hypothetical protein